MLGPTIVVSFAPMLDLALMLAPAPMLGPTIMLSPALVLGPTLVLGSTLVLGIQVGLGLCSKQRVNKVVNTHRKFMQPYHQHFQQQRPDTAG